VLALAFRAGGVRFALEVADVVELLPRTQLRPVAMAPGAVAGLLPFRGSLVPVVDLCRLVAGRDCAGLRSSRIIVLKLPASGGERLLGLLAEDVLDLVPIEETVPGLRLPEQPWLGDHLADQPELPQLLDAAKLLPAELERLFVAEAPT
jgi:chemotaxis-related protein WspB